LNEVCRHQNSRRLKDLIGWPKTGGRNRLHHSP
jgi:hypothetical protein